jgi:asparagine synthase (glutamine-hydrolysing)
MRRLSIIDLTTGHQPIHNENETVWVVCNGEIYNFLELRKELIEKGHIFYTNSDTEVIAHLYEDHGIDCFKHLNGMFGIAIWDVNRRQLILGRDRVGKKPLYYAFDGKRLVFSSELKCLLYVPDFQRKVNMSAMDYYLSFGYVPGELSIFEGVHKLPAGHILIYKAQKIDILPYWHLEFGNCAEDKGEEYYVETLRELFLDSVKKRLISDVPLGAFLSGGLDSSSIVAAMVQLGVNDIKTFTIGFEEEGYSELPYARDVADLLGTNHFELIVNPEMTQILPELVWFFDEPSSAIPTYYVSRFARSEVKVILSGDGGDELFAGYTRYIDHPFAKAIRTMPKALRLNVIHKLASCMPSKLKGVKFIRSASGNAFDFYASKINYFNPEEKLLLYSKDFKHRLNGSSKPLDWLRNYFTEIDKISDISRRQYTDIKTYLPDTILTKVDRASMAVSLETRAPLLDYRIVEFAGTIPDRYKMPNGRTKNVLKEMARDMLPQNIIDRKKKGFAIPKDIWFRGQLKDFANDILLSSDAKERGYFNIAYIKTLLEQHQEGGCDFSDQIWALLCLELWHLKYMDKKVSHKEIITNVE